MPDFLRDLARACGAKMAVPAAGSVRTADRLPKPESVRGKGMFNLAVLGGQVEITICVILFTYS